MSELTPRAYHYRLYPNAKQSEFFAKTFGCARFIWNTMLHDKIEYYDKYKETLHNTPAQYKKTFEWLKEVDSLALANVQLDLQGAFRSFFSRPEVGFPKFKKKGVKDSYKTNNQNGTVSLTASTVRLPKIGVIRARVDRLPKGKIRNATVSMSRSGKYYVSVQVEEEIAPLPKTDAQVGIDLGLTHFATLSDGTKITGPKERIAELEKKVAKAQRILSRRREVAKAEKRKLSESKNYQKQRIKVAKLHESIANVRKDFHHKLSSSLIKNHDVIVIEDLNVSGMVKNPRLARAISRSGWSSFASMLKYKAQWYGRQLVQIDRWFPSSKTCSSCGEKIAKLPLSVRKWTCGGCSAQLDRDVNASLNILKEGLRLISQPTPGTGELA